MGMNRGSRLVSLHLHKQKVRILQVAQELHWIGLEHENLLRQQLVQLRIERNFSLFCRRVRQSVLLLLYNLLQHFTTKGFKCEVGIVAKFQQVCLEQVAIETATTTA